MKKKETDQLRIDPEQRLYPKLDPVSISEFPVADREEMGASVLDDCAQEHSM